MGPIAPIGTWHRRRLQIDQWQKQQPFEHMERHYQDSDLLQQWNRSRLWKHASSNSPAIAAPWPNRANTGARNNKACEPNRAQSGDTLGTQPKIRWYLALYVLARHALFFILEQIRHADLDPPDLSERQDCLLGI